MIATYIVALISAQPQCTMIDEIPAFSDQLEGYCIHAESVALREELTEILSSNLQQPMFCQCIVVLNYANQIVHYVWSHLQVNFKFASKYS